MAAEVASGGAQEPVATIDNGDKTSDERGRVSESSKAQSAAEFSQQAEKLALQTPSSAAVKAHFITPQDPVIVTENGDRLPGVPLQDAHRLNVLREELRDDKPETVDIQEDGDTKERISNVREGGQGTHKVIQLPDGHSRNGMSMQKSAGGTLRHSMPPSHTNPLFPPLPLYGPPSFLRDMQCLFFRISAFFLSLAFLGAIVLGALFTSIPGLCKGMYYTITCRNIDTKRPFFEEEIRREKLRKEKTKAWKRNIPPKSLMSDRESTAEEFPPTEGGRDPIKCDVSYYARRVGLDVEPFHVQTEDGFIIDLWHVFDPKEYTKLSPEERDQQGPDVFQSGSKKKLRDPNARRKFPVLLMHGLLQSSGAYCCNDDESLAFWLCKSGYDVWLGNNRCGFEPKHSTLTYSDPRMWCWNIRQMGVFDLAALTSRVLLETGFERLGLICHSQGTTQTFVALAKEQRPELGEKLTVFCALAPAAYAGPLIGKMYFKFMRIISPTMFRLMFGIHAFIPFMMQMHELLHPRVYGWLGYKVFSFLFDWSDQRWDRGLRDRMFQFAPVYVSAESMRWWLGRECFAKHKCILETADSMDDSHQPVAIPNDEGSSSSGDNTNGQVFSPISNDKQTKGSTAWYDERVPPFALWVGGRDLLVDGRKLLRRFEVGREPHVRVVHSKVIDEYEHLDVIWAMDAEQQVFRELREVLWKTCDARGICRVPTGCENVAPWKPAGVESPRRG
jgi:pimeloyl-ACP methyl ester carboxylesterase